MHVKRKEASKRQAMPANQCMALWSLSLLLSLSLYLARAWRQKRLKQKKRAELEAILAICAQKKRERATHTHGESRRSLYLDIEQRNKTTKNGTRLEHREKREN